MSIRGGSEAGLYFILGHFFVIFFLFFILALKKFQKYFALFCASKFKYFFFARLLSSYCLLHFSNARFLCFYP